MSYVANFFSLTTKTNRDAWVVAALFASLYFAIYFLFFSLEVQILRDSASYIDNASIRTSFYPAFLDLVGSLGLSIQSVPKIQLSLFILSLTYLCYTALRLQIGVVIILIYTLVVAFNVYVNGFHESILTESLTFSTTNLLVAGLLQYSAQESMKGLVLSSICVGLLVGMRPSALAMIPALFVTVVFVYSGKTREFARDILVAGITCGIVLSAEAGLFYASNSERDSTLPRQLFAKMAMLTTHRDFSPDLFPASMQDLVIRIDSAFNPAQNYLSEIDSTLLRPSITADIEIYAQWSFFNEEVEQAAKSLAMSAQDLRSSLGWIAIKNYPYQYLKLSANYYFGFWVVGATSTLGQNQSIIKHPFPGMGAGADSKNYPHWTFALALPFFLMIGAFAASLSAYALFVLLTQVLSWRPNETSPLVRMSLILIIFAQGCLILAALVNVSIIRYLMAVFPMIALSTLLVVQHVIGRYAFGRGTAKNRAILQT